MNAKKPQIPIDRNVHTALKQYCALKGKKLSHVASKVLRAFLNTEHRLVEYVGEMIINREGEKPKTIAVVMEDQEGKKPRRSLNDIQIVKRGNTYIVKKREARIMNVVSL